MEKIKLKALTFDDVLLLPRYTDFLPAEADLATRISRNITLKIPLVSAAMDTVTESRMAIALAENGGIGIIHKNNSIEKQAQLVKAVKKYESGVVRDPTTIKSTKTIEELMQLTNELSISGMPVVDDGELMGIVTSRDFRYADNPLDPVSSIMTSKDKLICWAGGPHFDNSFHESVNTFELVGPRAQYRIEVTDAPTQKIADQYRQFADTAILLRALLHPGGIPPFPRMELNKRIASEIKLPTSVTLQIDPGGSLITSGLSSVMQRHLHSTHRIHPGLRADDLQRIADAEACMAIAEEVSLAAYTETEKK